MYKHVQGDSLAIMDSFLEELDYKIFCGKYDTDMKISSMYFIEFVYDRLVEMGCEEIQQEKYINAVEGYKHASWANYDKNKTTMDYIHENANKNDNKSDKKKYKELEKNIYEIMEMYHNYSSKCYKELSEIYVSSGTKGRS